MFLMNCKDGHAHETASTPLADALLSAIKTAARAQRQKHTLRAEDVAVNVARAALAASLEPRAWDLYEEDVHYATVTASSLADAIEFANNNVCKSNYSEGALVKIEARCQITGEFMISLLSNERDFAVNCDRVNAELSRLAVLGYLDETKTAPRRAN